MNVTYSGLIGSITVDSCGTLQPNSGPVAYTTKTCDPEIVTFHGPPAPAPSPSAGPTLAPGQNLVDCIDKFVSNPMCQPLPANPAIAPNSAAWSALEFQSGHQGFAPLGIGTGKGSDDGSEPITDLPIGAPFASLVMSCDVEVYSAGTCASHGDPNGSTQQIPLNGYVAANSDHHLAVDNHAYAGEFDYWNAPFPIIFSGTWHVGGAGFCPWSGNGTGCSGSTATNIVTSMGAITQDLLTKAESTPNGTLPYALGASVLCGDPTYVFPATSSDGSNTNTSSACVGHTGAGQRPPEGTRWFLNLTDDQVNATNNAPYVKAILRTINKQHFGGTITDTNWSGAPGLAMQYHHDPFTPQAIEAKLTGTNFELPITTNGIDLSTEIIFCSNGTC